MATPAAAGRPSWSGAITFGLVAVPVKLYPVIESEHGPRLHQYHREDAGRIRQRKVCEAENRELSADEIARGQERGGTMVVLTDEDMEQLPLPSKHVIDVHAFLPASSISDLMWSTPYWVGLGEKAPSKPYLLLHKAMTQSGTVAVTKIALRDRESLAVLRPVGKLLVLQTIRWPDEIRSREGIHGADVDEPVDKREIKMALKYAAARSDGYDLETERDTWVAALNDLLAAKASGGEVTATAETAAAAAPTMDIMAALQASIAESKAARGETKPTKKAPAKKTTRKRAS